MKYEFTEKEYRKKDGFEPAKVDRDKSLGLSAAGILISSSSPPVCNIPRFEAGEYFRLSGAALHPLPKARQKAVT
jgi:hypothetical protein